MDTTTHNPLLKEKKEFLERQSQEYKNALRGEVQELKEKSQDIGKKAVMAGGAILLGYALVKAISAASGSSEPQKLLEYKGKKKKGKYSSGAYSQYEDLTNNAGSFDVTDVPYTETIETPTNLSLSESGENKDKSSVAKDIFGVVAQQITAYLIILGTRKLEEYLNARKNASDNLSEDTIGYSSGQPFEDTYSSPGAANIQSAAAE